MQRPERTALLQMDATLREAQHVLADWLEPGVLSAGEAQERLLALLDNPRLALAQADVLLASAEPMEIFG